MLVLTPSMPILLFNLFVMNVLLLASSKSAYVLTLLLGLSLWYRTTGTIQHMVAEFNTPAVLLTVLVAFECADSSAGGGCGCGCSGGPRGGLVLGDCFGVVPCSRVWCCLLHLSQVDLVLHSDDT